MAERTLKVGDFTHIGGQRCHVLTRGRGRPVVLLHGNGGLGEEILSAFPAVPGVRWIAPDRPGFGQTDAPQAGRYDPLSQARWLDALLTDLGIPQATVVAHSLASGLALAFAATRPWRLSRLVLLSPFCRPTPERLMPWLRLASAPVVGGWVRKLVVPTVMRRFRTRILGAYMAPNAAPPWLLDLPVSRVASPQAVQATAAELRCFNASMRRVERALRLSMPVTVVHGLEDRTAQPHWHLPWLHARCDNLTSILVPGCGHGLHHAAPDLVRQAILGPGVRPTLRVVSA